MSYGATAGVAALSRRFTNSGTYDGTTNPTSTTVTTWLAQVSSMLDVALASSGFSVPFTDADITPALDGIVNALVSDLANAANSAGRFFTDNALQYGVAPMSMIRKDILQWVSDNSAGLASMGANRIVSTAGQIGYRDADDNGDPVEPLFPREGFSGWGHN
jgi:hypothetical protein